MKRLVEHFCVIIPMVLVFLYGYVFGMDLIFSLDADGYYTGRVIINQLIWSIARPYIISESTEEADDPTPSPVEKGPIVEDSVLPTQPSFEIPEEPVIEETPVYYLYRQELETSSEEMGSYDLNLEVYENPWGFNYDQAVGIIHSIGNMVGDACGYSKLSWGSGKYSLSRGSWGDDALENECWDVLDSLDKTDTLERSDPTLDDERVVICDSTADCQVITENLVAELADDAAQSHQLLKSPTGVFYEVNEVLARLTPNIAKYPGFGLGRFVLPTTIMITSPTQISQMGITNWGRDQMCYEKAGFVLMGEIGIAMPGTQVCVDSSEFPRSEDEIESYWEYYSISKIGDNYVTWWWVPVMDEDRALTIHVMDVDFVHLTQTNVPSQKINNGWEDRIDYPVNEYEWKEGQAFTVEAIDISYYKVDSDGTEWLGYNDIFMGMKIKSFDGEERYINSGYSIEFDCKQDGSFACRGSDDFSGHYIEVGDALIVTRVDMERGYSPIEFTAYSE